MTEEPIRGYVEDCADSWSDWSDEDRDRFLRTTVVDNNKSLYDWAKENSVI